MDDRRILSVDERELPGGLRLLDRQGEFDVYSAALVRSALAEADAAGCPRIIVDLTDVPILDSTALSVLVVAQKRLRRTGRELVVVMPDSGMATKFRIAGLDRFFSISPTREQALGGLV
jgi:anti-sigma B factor antagonist